MATPETSDTTTHGVRVGATAYYLPDESDPDDRKFLFGYTIVIKNDSKDTVQLVSRYWLIIDGNGRQDEVRGPGVVGQTPRLSPAPSRVPPSSPTWASTPSLTSGVDDCVDRSVR